MIKHEANLNNYTQSTWRHALDHDSFWSGWAEELHLILVDLLEDDGGVDTVALSICHCAAINIVLHARSTGSMFSATIDRLIDEYMQEVDQADEVTQEFLDTAFNEFWRLYYRA